MVILGVNTAARGSSAALYDGGRIVAAVAEERLTRVRGAGGFPRRSVAEVLRLGRRAPAEVEVVALPGFDWAVEGRQIALALARNAAEGRRPGVSPLALARHLARFAEWGAAATAELRHHEAVTREGLRGLGVTARIRRVEHALSHQALAFFGSGLPRALIACFDEYGSGMGGALAIGSEAGIERLCGFPWPHAPALLVEQAGAVLGLPAGHAAGRLAALAARGDPNVLRDQLAARFTVRGGDVRYAAAYDDGPLRAMAARYTRFEVAAAVQAVVEDIVCAMVTHHVGRYETERVVLAGVLAANPRLVQRVATLPGVTQVATIAGAVEAGRAMGAALWVAHESGALPRGARLDPGTLGPTYGDAELRAALERAGLTFDAPADLSAAAAEQLAQGASLAVFDGATPIGERGLGHRCIVARADDPVAVRVLSERLGRPAGLPFGAATLDRPGEGDFSGPAAAGDCARSQACTFDATPALAAACPSVVHADGTGRPVWIVAEEAPVLRGVLEAAAARTGRRTFLHAALRLGDEALASSPDDATRVFELGRLDALVMGRYLARRTA